MKPDAKSENHVPVETEKPPVFRFAPSPNGHLHLGHAFSALFTQAMARRFDGRLLLRIEDIDRDRCRPEYETRIYEDLAALGIAWETPVRRQSKHFEAYAAALAKLQALGVVYPCFASRAEIAAASAGFQTGATDPDGAPLYRSLWRDAPSEAVDAAIAAGKPYALRLNMRKAAMIARERLGGGSIAFTAFNAEGSATRQEAHPERWGDVVIARKETPASYHLAVVTDDALQGVTHVTRGLDLLAATDIHRVLQILLALPEPRYCHHRLILDASGRKLSKSAKDKSLRQLQAEGGLAEAVDALMAGGG